MTATLMLNGLSASTVRLMIPYLGVWTADVDFDPGATPASPTGPAQLTIGNAVMVGFIDPGGVGAIGPSGKARVLGGFGGWHKPLPAQHFTNDGGVLSTAVLSVTASQVGEKVVQATPTTLGPHYTRAAGPASRVLSGLDWYVDTLTGITMVGPRVPITVRPDVVQVLDWDGLEQRATIACDAVLQPGSMLIDTRFGTAQVRDVEQTFDADGARATAHCRPAALDIGGLLASFARESVRPEYQQHHTYRVVLQSGDGRLALQAVKALGAVPDMLPITMCMGVPGFDAKLAPGVEVLVAFADGDPSKPLVRAFAKGSPPLEVSLNAVRIALGMATDAVAKASNVVNAINALQTNVSAQVKAWVALGGTPGVPVTTDMIKTVATALTTADTTGANAVSAATALIPSPRVFLD